MFRCSFLDQPGASPGLLSASQVCYHYTSGPCSWRRSWVPIQASFCQGLLSALPRSGCTGQRTQPPEDSSLLELAPFRLITVSGSPGGRPGTPACQAGVLPLHRWPLFLEAQLGPRPGLFAWASFLRFLFIIPLWNSSRKKGIDLYAFLIILKDPIPKFLVRVLSGGIRLTRAIRGILSIDHSSCPITASRQHST